MLGGAVRLRMVPTLLAWLTRQEMALALDTTPGQRVPHPRTPAGSAPDHRRQGRLFRRRPSWRTGPAHPRRRVVWNALREPAQRCPRRRPATPIAAETPAIQRRTTT